MTQPVNGAPNPNVSDVSMAVTKEQAKILHAAIGRGADMRLLLLGQKSNENVHKVTYTDDQIAKILADDFDPNGKAKDDEAKGDDKTFVTADLPVPMEDLKPGTLLTKELIDTKFTVLPIKPPAPDNFVRDIREQTGKYLTKELTANQFVPKSYIADSIKPKEVVVRPVGPPPVYHDTVVQTPSGVKKFRYLVKPEGGYTYVGEVKIEMDVPKDKADEESKAEDNKKQVMAK